MRTWFAWTIPLLFTVACAHNEVTAKAPVATAPATPVPAAPAIAEQSCSQDTDCTARQLCIRSRCVDVTKDPAECQNVRVHFSFDRADLDSKELPLLQRVARCVMADQGLHVIVEGNTDERGTEEYNLSLGNRRANAVQKYLQGLGVPAPQLKTVSYGKEKPLCTEHNEGCWAENRRAAVQSLEAAR
jgi:peptidoglycan-associated lipoprotein